MTDSERKPRNPFSDDERYRLKQLGLAAFKGAHVTPAETSWLEKMWRKNPEEYTAIVRAERDQEVERIRGMRP